MHPSASAGSLTFVCVCVDIASGRWAGASDTGLSLQLGHHGDPEYYQKPH